MQSFGYDLRRMTRWTPSKEVNIRTGEVAVTYSPVATYMMSFVPSYVQTSRTADGMIDTKRQRVIVNHTKSFVVGDRIGSPTEQMYEVMEVQTFRTNQQMIVEDVDAD